MAVDFKRNGCGNGALSFGQNDAERGVNEGQLLAQVFKLYAVEPNSTSGVMVSIEKKPI